MTARRILVVMAKAPRAGHVKTRLSRDLTPDRVAALYRCLLEDTLDLARRVTGVRVGIMGPPEDRAALEALAGADVHVAGQAGRGLASALTSVFREFAAAGFNRIVAFNADSPHLPADVLQSAFEALDTHETVVGPTLDGGYYLIGARRAHPALFEGDRLGTANALESLLARVGERSLTSATLTPWYDVDVAADLARLDVELGEAPERAPRTAALLARWRTR